MKKILLQRDDASVQQRLSQSSDTNQSNETESYQQSENLQTDLLNRNNENNGNVVKSSPVSQQQHVLNHGGSQPQNAAMLLHSGDYKIRQPEVESLVQPYEVSVSGGNDGAKRDNPTTEKHFMSTYDSVSRPQWLSAANQPAVAPYPIISSMPGPAVSRFPLERPVSLFPSGGVIGSGFMEPNSLTLMPPYIHPSFYSIGFPQQIRPELISSSMESNPAIMNQSAAYRYPPGALIPSAHFSQFMEAAAGHPAYKIPNESSLYEDQRRHGDQRGDERRGDERRGNERCGDERRGDERRGDERRGDERRGDERRRNERRGDERRGDESRCSDQSDESGDSVRMSQRDEYVRMSASSVESSMSRGRSVSTESSASRHDYDGGLGSKRILSEEELESRSYGEDSKPKDGGRTKSRSSSVVTDTDQSADNGSASFKQPYHYQSKSSVTSSVNQPSGGRGKGRPAKAAAFAPGIGGSSGNGIGTKSVIKCSICDKLFNNSSALAKHKLTHSDERKYSCTICSKAFKRQDHLNGHMMTHSSKKPFECKFIGCAKSYCDARSLRRHLENHHQESLAYAAAAAGRSVSDDPDYPDSDQSSYYESKVDYDGGPVDYGRASSVEGCRASEGAAADKAAIVQRLVWTSGYNPLDEPKPVKCHVCGRGFKNIPALNGHMRLHGGYTRKDSDGFGSQSSSDQAFSESVGDSAGVSGSYDERRRSSLFDSASVGEESQDSSHVTGGNHQRFVISGIPRHLSDTSEVMRGREDWNEGIERSFSNDETKKFSVFDPRMFSRREDVRSNSQIIDSSAAEPREVTSQIPVEKKRKESDFLYFRQNGGGISNVPPTDGTENVIVSKGSNGDFAGYFNRNVAPEKSNLENSQFIKTENIHFKGAECKSVNDWFLATKDQQTGNTALPVPQSEITSNLRLSRESKPNALSNVNRFCDEANNRSDPASVTRESNGGTNRTEAMDVYREKGSMDYILSSGNATNASDVNRKVSNGGDIVSEKGMSKSKLLRKQERVNSRDFPDFLAPSLPASVSDHLNTSVRINVQEFFDKSSAGNVSQNLRHSVNSMASSDNVEMTKSSVPSNVSKEYEANKEKKNAANFVMKELLQGDSRKNTQAGVKCAEEVRERKTGNGALKMEKYDLEMPSRIKEEIHTEELEYGGNNNKRNLSHALKQEKKFDSGYSESSFESTTSLNNCIKMENNSAKRLATEKTVMELNSKYHPSDNKQQRVSDVINVDQVLAEKKSQAKHYPIILNNENDDIETIKKSLQSMQHRTESLMEASVTSYGKPKYQVFLDQCPVETHGRNKNDGVQSDVTVLVLNIVPSMTVTAAPNISSNEQSGEKSHHKFSEPNAPVGSLFRRRRMNLKLKQGNQYLTAALPLIQSPISSPRIPKIVEQSCCNSPLMSKQNLSCSHKSNPLSCGLPRSACEGMKSHCNENFCFSGNHVESGCRKEFRSSHCCPEKRNCGCSETMGAGSCCSYMNTALHHPATPGFRRLGCCGCCLNAPLSACKSSMAIHHPNTPGYYRSACHGAASPNHGCHKSVNKSCCSKDGLALHHPSTPGYCFLDGSRTPCSIGKTRLDKEKFRISDDKENLNSPSQSVEICKSHSYCESGDAKRKKSSGSDGGKRSKFDLVEDENTTSTGRREDNSSNSSSCFSFDAQDIYAQQGSRQCMQTDSCCSNQVMSAGFRDHRDSCNCSSARPDCCQAHFTPVRSSCMNRGSCTPLADHGMCAQRCGAARCASVCGFHTPCRTTPVCHSASMTPCTQTPRSSCHFLFPPSSKHSQPNTCHSCPSVKCQHSIEHCQTPQHHRHQQPCFQQQSCQQQNCQQQSCQQQTCQQQNCQQQSCQQMIGCGCQQQHCQHGSSQCQQMNHAEVLTARQTCTDKSCLSCGPHNERDKKKKHRKSASQKTCSDYEDEMHEKKSSGQQTNVLLSPPDLIIGHVMSPSLTSALGKRKSAAENENSMKKTKILVDEEMSQDDDSSDDDDDDDNDDNSEIQIKVNEDSDSESETDSQRLNDNDTADESNDNDDDNDDNDDNHKVEESIKSDSLSIIDKPSCSVPFRNPLAPVSKAKPAPLHIPANVNNYGFASQLRSPLPRDLVVNRNQSPPPYTPPPMLSPARTASGLFWNLQHSAANRAVVDSANQRRGLRSDSQYWASTSESNRVVHNGEGWIQAAAVGGVRRSSREKATLIDNLPPTTDRLPHVNVGRQFQAEIPNCLVRSRGHVTDGDDVDTLLWHPETELAAASDEVDKYLEKFSQDNSNSTDAKVSTETKSEGSVKKAEIKVDKEMALHVLHVCHGDIKAAQLVLMYSDPTKTSINSLDTYCYSVAKSWSTSEISRFLRALKLFGKDFSSISKYIGGSKSIKECIHKYYDLKNSSQARLQSRSRVKNVSKP